MNRARYILKYLLPREKFIEKPYKRRHVGIIEILRVNLLQYVFRVIFFKIYIRFEIRCYGKISIDPRAVLGIFCSLKQYVSYA